MTHGHTTTADDGTTLAWSRAGTRRAETPAVVLVHGITESAASFDPIVERLVATGALEVITLDLRGHGESGHAASYDLASMSGDVITVIDAAGLSAERVHLVGHSLGGAVVSAAGSAIAVASVVNIDQSLQLAAFKEQLVAAEPLLRDPNQFRVVVDMMFEMMSGTMLGNDERTRIDSLRRADHDVVLGVWELLLVDPADQIAATVDTALGGYHSHPTPYLSIFGLDPGDEYPSWLAERIEPSTVELWADHGHYPHLVDPDRFVDRLTEFWGV